MIEKLKTPKSINWADTPEGLIQRHEIITGVYETVNELVDAVNELQKHEEQHLDLLTELNEMRLHQNKTPVDPYAEQRQWIGRLCRFWDEEHVPSFDIIGILTDINDKEYRPFQVNHRDRWEHCEPVKPDEDIIFKGE